MKKLAYITMIAALIFGIQSPDAVCATPNAIEEAKEGKGQARITYDSASETLKSPKTPKPLVCNLSTLSKPTIKAFKPVEFEM